ncbi:MAG: hypothetical protein HKUEN01_21000 [Candidatus Kuenenia stuttgartiensis]|jgi:hypothetical protein|nr:MAG: hypothetical protein HKUEN01_21000 [Candidatus Kuenenia stuttgartiensis]
MKYETNSKILPPYRLQRETMSHAGWGAEGGFVFSDFTIKNFAKKCKEITEAQG